MTIKWGLSILDWHAHAIVDDHNHPIGVFKALCGHLLMMVTELSKTPGGNACKACTDAVTATTP